MEKEITFSRMDLPLKPGEIRNRVSFFSDREKIQINRYDSVFDFVNDVNHNCKVKKVWNEFKYKGRDRSWQYGEEYPNYESSFEAITSGKIKDSLIKKVDLYKAQLLKEFPQVSELQKHAFTKKRRRIFADDGDELDIDRFMSGESEMWQKRINKMEKKAVRLFLNCWVSAGNDPETLIKNAQMFAAISDILNDANIATEIQFGLACDHTTFSRSNPVHTTLTTFIVKRANETLDIQKLISSGLPAIMRHFWFSECQNTCNGEWQDNAMGCPLPEHSESLEAALKFSDIDLCVFGQNGVWSKSRMIFDKMHQMLNIQD